MGLFSFARRLSRYVGGGRTLRRHTYRLNSDTLAVGTRQGEPIVFTIPTGAIVTAEDRVPEMASLSDVQWEGKAVTILSVDLRKRCTRIH